MSGIPIHHYQCKESGEGVMVHLPMVRIIVDPLNKRKDYQLDVETARDKFKKGELAYDLTARTYCQPVEV
jgi:hypothetical protein